MKFSAIATVFNEEKNILEFLESISRQTKKPSELVIVDGGSSDNTVKIIKEFAKDNKWVKLYVKAGANISEGRNYAIKKSKNEYIVAIDAGCKLDNNNFKHMIKPFERGFDVISGNWKPTYDNNKQEAMARILVPNLERPIDNKRFLPSSRNIAFKKSCWKKVGGYPEGFYTGEDTLFNLRLKESGFKFYISKKALVYWKMRDNFRKFWKQFYLYGKGDKETKNLINFRLNGLLNFAMVLGFWSWLILSCYMGFVNNPFFIPFFFIFPVYLVYGGIKTAISSKKASMLYYGTIAFFIKRVAYVFGATFG